FKRQTKGYHPMLVDTSALIDGRIYDVSSTGVLEHQLVVPRFIVDELQTLADSADKLKRARGRRGLDVMAKLQNHKLVDLYLYDSSVHDNPAHETTDQKLLDLAKQLNARVLT